MSAIINSEGVIDDSEQTQTQSELDDSPSKVSINEISLIAPNFAKILQQTLEPIVEKLSTVVLTNVELKNCNKTVSEDLLRTKTDLQNIKNEFNQNFTEFKQTMRTKLNDVEKRLAKANINQTAMNDIRMQLEIADKRIKKIEINLNSLTNHTKTMFENTACADWETYKDEKCFKVFDTLESYDAAVIACDEHNATLVSITSSEEQKFIETYLFGTHEIVENVWISLKYANNNYKWINNLELTYTNWAEGSPKTRSDYCVQIGSDDLVLGKWSEMSCTKKNLVLCQKLPTITIQYLQTMADNTRKMLFNTQKQLENMEDMLSAKTAIIEIGNKVNEWKPVISRFYVPNNVKRGSNDFWVNCSLAGLNKEEMSNFVLSMSKDNEIFYNISGNSEAHTYPVSGLETYQFEVSDHLKGSVRIKDPTVEAKGNYRCMLTTTRRGESRSAFKEYYVNVNRATALIISASMYYLLLIAIFYNL